MIKLKCQTDDECLQKLQIKLGCSTYVSICLLNVAKARANENGTLLNNEIDKIIEEKKR